MCEICGLRIASGCDHGAEAYLALLNAVVGARDLVKSIGRGGTTRVRQVENFVDIRYETGHRRRADKHEEKRSIIGNSFRGHGAGGLLLLIRRIS